MPQMLYRRTLLSALTSIFLILPMRSSAYARPRSYGASVHHGALLFDIRFDGALGSQPSHRIWHYDRGWDPNCRTYYQDGPSEMRIVKSTGTRTGKALAISVRPDPGKPGAYLSGRINTSLSRHFQARYGVFEARIKVPGGPHGAGSGSWPACWMMGTNFKKVGWPRCGEIDIMESAGDHPRIVTGTIHGPNGVGAGAPYTLPKGKEFWQHYHVFAVYWTPNSIRFAVDGHFYACFTPKDQPAGGWVFDHRFYVILNVAEGGTYGGLTNSTAVFPQTMLVDWIKAYAWKLAAPKHLSAVPAGPDTVRLTWTDTAIDQSGFVVQRSNSPDFLGAPKSIHLPAHADRYTDSGLVPGQNYYYRIAAISGKYSSAFTNTVPAHCWQLLEIGGGKDGSLLGLDGVYRFTFDGRGIRQTGDQLAMMGTAIAGDFSLRAQIKSSLPGSPAAVQGIMMRTDAAPASDFIALQIKAQGVVQLLRRNRKGLSIVSWKKLRPGERGIELLRRGGLVRGFVTRKAGQGLMEVGTPLAFSKTAKPLVGVFAFSGDTHSQSCMVDHLHLARLLPKPILAINCGGPTVAGYRQDEYFSPSGTSTVGHVISLRNCAHPAPAAIYQTNRYGTFLYNIPGLQPHKRYILMLNFCEQYWQAPRKRLFSVWVNSQEVLNDFDIFHYAGGAFKALNRRFVVRADARGHIHIRFVSQRDNAQVNGMSIYPYR